MRLDTPTRAPATDELSDPLFGDYPDVGLEDVASGVLHGHGIVYGV
jgi:hypothetical protein